MGSGNTYVTNDAKVISEMLEGETIIINLESGTYYSVNATGSAVWDMVKVRTGEEAMAATLVRAYEVEAETAVQALREFLEVLVGDGLIIKQEDVPAQSPADETETPTARLPFVAPALQRYEDMQQMLLADPIHDVDQMGWPILKQS